MTISAKYSLILAAGFKNNIFKKFYEGTYGKPAILPGGHIFGGSNSF